MPLPNKKQPQQQGKPPVEKQPPDQPVKQATPHKKPQPKVQKDETLKFQMSYANGGFNNGIEIKPAKDGKLELSITIYGGGENKKLGISGYSPQIQKLVQAYEVGASTEQNVEDITKNLKQYFERVNQVLSLKIIEILQGTDNQIKEAIKQTFKEVK
jgi:hypothetical protein